MPNSFLIQLFTLICLISFIPLKAVAKCTIEEVEFFLDKGFSQEQITRLCSTASGQNCPPCPKEKTLTQLEIADICKASNSASLDCSKCPQQSVTGTTSESSQEIDETRQNVALVHKADSSQSEREAIQKLKIAGDILNFDVDPEKIKYTKRVCVFSGDAQARGRRREYCHGINYTITRRNLQASPGKTLPIIGTPNALIVGDISLELNGSLKEYPSEVRKQLEAYVKDNQGKNETNFPAREEFSVAEIVQALQTLSR